MHKPKTNDVSFVHTDLSSFRSVVQKLTGPGDHARQELSKIAGKTGFKLQDRRKSVKKLRLKVLNEASTVSSAAGTRGLLASPVSTLEAWPMGRSPVSSSSGQDVRGCEEESGLTPPAPKLLPLFPEMH